MSNNEVKYSKDGRCPYCGSEDVSQTGRSDSFPRASSTDKYPEPRHKVWECKNCGREFYYKGGF